MVHFPVEFKSIIIIVQFININLPVVMLILFQSTFTICSVVPVIKTMSEIDTFKNMNEFVCHVLAVLEVSGKENLDNKYGRHVKNHNANEYK